MMEDACYDEVAAQLAPQDCLLLFSDGAVEIHNASGEMLGVEGLLRILRSFGYPNNAINASAVEGELLRFSNAIRLEDDLTFIEAKIL
jgi:serine phosphatase RsbU (regulator of sigma subunit)